MRFIYLVWTKAYGYNSFQSFLFFTLKVSYIGNTASKLLVILVGLLCAY